MTTPAKPKRNPTVLVTDSRESQKQRQQRPPMTQGRSSARLISVDNVLQYASEIPSGQRRGPATPRPRPQHNRTLSGRRPVDPKLAGRMVQPQHIPSRSSKVSEKLVLLPDANEVDDEEQDEFKGRDEDQRPPRDEDAALMRKPATMKEKSYAEKLPKASRTEKLSRVTAYCTAQAYKMRSTAEFVRTRHGAKTKLYDDCLYTVYHLPLLPGNEGYRIRSSPVLKSPGGKAVLDEEIERNERHEYREGFFGEEQYGVPSQPNQPPDLSSSSPHNANNDTNNHNHHPTNNDTPPTNENPVLQPIMTRRSSSPGSTAQLATNISTFAEMFVYTYGVVVFWNFTERQEKDILADLTFSSSPTTLTSTTALRRSRKAAEAQPLPTPGIPLTVRPLDEADFETEEFHFEYNPEIPRPRVFNDMITLRSADHMIKLSMSHAIAQSTKLSFFEERMGETMVEAQHVPRRLALRGELGMKREEVVRMVGRLFKSRVDVNLSSNMLDVPNFFWDSEPTLHPLYSAVREYLEIKPRIQVLNERCRVFLDLAEILSDSINDRKMSRLTWIIIILIVLSILVTLTEVFLRFGILTAGRAKAQSAVQAHLSGMIDGASGAAGGGLVGGNGSAKFIAGVGGVSEL